MALIASGVLAGAAPVTPLAAAAQAYTGGDVGRARALWLPLAGAGNAEAAFRLGLLADLGEGMPEDATKAYRWFRQAADAGHAAAEFNVAVMEDSGRGTSHDASGAAEWYARAAARGNRRAQYNLALLYTDGDGVPRNLMVARAWFRLAAAGGLPAAAEKLDALRPGRLPSDHLRPSATLHPVIPVAPRAGVAIASGDDAVAEIVWSAPAEELPVRYFLQVVARDGGAEREIHAGYLDITAALVRLDAAHHSYAWRVYTVSPRSASYTVSPWTPFTTRSLA